MVHFLINHYKNIINLMLVWILLLVLNPATFANHWAIMLAGLITGAYLFYFHYTNNRAQAQSLAFEPLDVYKKALDERIVACGLQPEDVRVRYAFADDGVAVALFNTIMIDPFVWKHLDLDENAQKAKQVIDIHVMPTLSQEKKILLNRIYETISTPVLEFIFKHELGHVVYNYSIKKIIVMGMIGFMLTVAGLETVLLCLPYMHSILAAALGILVAGFVDLFLSYSSNVFFKYRHEVNADLFAVKHSSQEEILAAAVFFEEYQKHANDYKKTLNIVQYLPQIIASGHPDGKARAAYLRKLTIN